MATTAWLQRLEKVDRAEHFDAEGGGAIVRTFYCEPYTAHKTVVTALKGTVRQVAGSADTWERVKPMQDPLYPQFYCSDVKVTPFAPEAIRGAKPTGFDPNPVDQVAEVRTALSKVDDFDFGSTLDGQLPEINIPEGGINIEQGILGTVNSRPASAGTCGAYITATFRPLIFVDGLSDGEDQFDYVDPQWKPITKLTQLGRDLSLIAPNSLAIGSPLQMCGGSSDTATVPEILWEFSCRRLMVPFLPFKTYSALSNKINTGTMQVGSYAFPGDCVRMEMPDVEQMMAPDGVKYYNITLHFTIRTLYTDYMKIKTDGTQAETAGNPGWNHQLGIPSVLRVQTAGLSYWPVGWKSGLFGAWGAFRGLYLHDTDTAAVMPAGINPLMGWAAFRAGFKDGQ